MDPGSGVAAVATAGASRFQANQCSRAAFLLGSTPSARAEEWDKQSFWYGFLLGSSTTVCELLENGLLTKNDARDWLQTLFKADPDIPAVSQSSAKAELRGNADFKDCPVPR
jgi:hypothetical protein